MNKHASLLGKRGKGKPKTLTDAERKRRGQLGAQFLRQWHAKQGHKIANAEPIAA